MLILKGEFYLEIGIRALIGGELSKEINNSYEIIEEGRPYKEHRCYLKENGSKKEYSLGDYSPHLIKLKDALILRGKYAFSQNNLWLIGATYHTNKIITDEKSVEEFSKENILGLLKEMNFLPKVNIEKGFLVGGLGSTLNNFGHFIFEYLPKIFYANKRVTKVPFLIDQKVPNRFLEFCDLLGIKKNRLIKFDGSKIISVKELYVSGVLCHRFPKNGNLCLDINSMLEMRNEIKKKSDVKNSSIKAPFVFISREAEKWRRILNENEIFDYFCSKATFVKFQPKELNIVDQVNTAATSKILVSPLGGASPLSFFCDKESSVIEITNPLIRGDWGHKVWAMLVGFNFFRVDGYYDNECENSGGIPIDRNFKVELKNLLSVCESISFNK